MATEEAAQARTARPALGLRLARVRTREVVLASLLAAAFSSALAVFGPPAGDAPAHLYRTLLVREGVLVWDNLWYAGHYPLASYSVLYYFVAAIVGNLPLAVAASVASAALFASIAGREWGDAARWPARAFAVLGAGTIVAGTFAYAVALAFALGSVRLLQARRLWPALACAALALLSSPLAFLFLCLVLAAAALVRRPSRSTGLVVASGMAVLAGLELGILALFPTEGRYGFRAQELGLLLAAVVPAAALALRARRARVLAVFFVLWAVAAVLSFLVASPIGSTVTRPRFFMFALALVPAILTGFRPRVLAVWATVATLAYTVSPYAFVAPAMGDSRPAAESFWKPALDFLRSRATPDYRVDVVPTFDNWEAYYVPRDGFALARGWYRQLDLARNPVLYSPDLSAEDYRTWLRSLGVRYVLLPNVSLDRLAAEPQADVLRSGRSGLVVTFRSRDWTIYELPQATPILTGPARARLDDLGHTRVSGRVGAAGSYLLRIRYTPYWDVREGAVCVEEAPGEMTRLLVRRPGRFELAIDSRRGRSAC